MKTTVRRALLLCLALLAFLATVPGGGTLARRHDGQRSAIRAGEVNRTSVYLRATYDARLRLTWKSGAVNVRSAMQVTNTSGGPIDRLELNTLAAALGNLHLKSATVAGSPVRVRQTGQTLVVSLGGVLPKGASASVVIEYTARLRSGSAGRDFFFSRDRGIASVHRWIPWVSRKRPFFGSNFGDPFFTAISPQVRVRLVADRALTWASVGSRLSKSRYEATFSATNVRDFNFTAAPDYGRSVGYSKDGQTRIVVHTRTLPRAVILDSARDAIGAFEAQLGRYPYPRLTISESSGGHGMESPGHIWIPTTYPRSLLRFLTVHETAHQWFYAVVGNDQPMEPFADEAVAEFMTRWYLNNFRSSGCSKGPLDLSIYGYSASCFYERIYIQGANFLNDLRKDMGSDRFWQGLRGYWQRNQFQFGSTRELLEVLRRKADRSGVNVLPRYRERFPSLY